MPKKLKKSKPSIMKQKQVVNINITNPKRKAKRGKSKPKTKPSNLYPSQLQSHNSGVVLPFHHQFYIPPTDKSMPQIEELINTHRDGNLLQIKQSNDLIQQLGNNQRITNQLAQSAINAKSPAKIYDLLMNEHLSRNAPKKLKHEMDEEGQVWEDVEVPINKKSPIKLARGRGRPKNPLEEALPQEPSLIPKKSRGRPALSDEEKAKNKAERLANKKEEAGAGIEEHKDDLAQATRTPIKLRARKKRVVINANI